MIARVLGLLCVLATTTGFSCVRHDVRADDEPRRLLDPTGAAGTAAFRRMCICDVCHSVFRSEGHAERASFPAGTFIPREESGRIDDSEIVRAGLLDHHHVHSWHPVEAVVGSGVDSWLWESMDFPARNPLVERLAADASARDAVRRGLEEGRIGRRAVREALERPVPGETGRVPEGGQAAYDRLSELLGGR